MNLSNKIMKPARSLLLLLCFSWFAFAAFAEPVDSKTAATTVKGWLRMDRKPFGKTLGENVKSVETFKDAAGKPVYHVVNLEPSGFVIVSAEDQTEPIIAFVDQGHYDPSPANPLGALVSRDLPQRVAHARAHGGSSAGFKHRGEWQKLQLSAAGGPQPKALASGSVSDLRVAPFVQTLWDQMDTNGTNGPACYNYFTPPHGPGSPINYYCGCVATAMAQLMYYFQFPSTGVGQPCFQITVNGNPMARNLSGGDGNGGPYNWTDMPLDPSIGATLDQRMAIGALTSDAGIAVKMQYALAESSAYMTDAKTALVTTFKYSNAIENLITNLDTGCFECSLYQMMNPNLDARLPVLLGITGDPGGHAIVVDGYGYFFGAIYHHLNMGWGGAYNAWYALPIIDMVDAEGVYTYFWDVTDCLYNVFTNGSGEIISGRVLDISGAPISGAGITALGTRGNTYSAVTDTNGIYALVGVPSATTFTLTVTNAGYFPVSSNYTTATSSDNLHNSGNIWGANFTLVVAQGPPTITTQPQDQTVTVGTNATFGITAGGQLPLFYQWQYQPSGSLIWTNLSDDENYSGSGTATLTVSQTDPSMDGEPFQCIVTNTLGSATSSQAVLHVVAAPFVDITTIAGLAGTPGNADGTNTGALFNTPCGIAVDNNTNVYVADKLNHVIRMLALSGTNWVSSTIAGLAGNPGSANGTNGNARFTAPCGVAVDGAGNVYVADTGNSTIRKLTPSGTNWVVSTISGLAGSPGTNNGSGSVARFHYPMGLAVDSDGSVYVADQANYNIRKLTPSGAIWTASTIAGASTNSSNDGINNAAGFGQPYGVAVDTNGIVYVVDRWGPTIRKVAPSGMNWVVTTIAGLSGSFGSADGIGSAARFIYPTGIAAGSDGNLYVADQGNNTVRRISPAGTNWLVFTVAGVAGSSGSTDGFGPAVRFNSPFGVAVDINNNLYVSDSGNDTIRMDPLIATPTPFSVQLVKQQPGNPFALAWNAMAGRAYQVQFKTNLSQPVWSNLTSVTPSTWTGVTPVSTGTDPQRFYRVVPVP